MLEDGYYLRSRARKQRRLKMRLTLGPPSAPPPTRTLEQPVKDELAEEMRRASTDKVATFHPTAADRLLQGAAHIESLEAKLEKAEEERRIVLQNRRVNDAVQTALERGELSISSEGWLEALKELSQ